MDYQAQRRDRLMQLLPTEELDAFLVGNPVNVTYLTGFSGDSSYLLLGRQRSLLISDERYRQQIAEECSGLEVHIRPPAQLILPAVAEVIGKLGFRAVGFESSHRTVADHEKFAELLPTVSWKGQTDWVERLRMVKDDSELAEIREAVGIAERAFNMFRALLRPEDREKDLCDAMETYIRRAGGWCGSFPAIVAVGKRAALAHAPATDHRVGDGELVLVDWGASGRRYKSDLTRVLATRKISPKLEKVYGVVLRAQEQALRTLRPGVKAHDVDAAARAVLDQAGFGPYFGHGLGHGVGLQVHEAPALRQNSQTVLQAGMVTTVEPGVYLPEWGGVRIEDDVLITAEGCELLSHVPRNLNALVCEF